MRLENWVGARHSRFWATVVFASRLMQAPAYWLTGGAFVLLYVAVEWATFVYQLDGLGITLWSPATGLGLILLMGGGLSFAPFVFVGSLISNYAVYTGPRGIVAPVGTSLVMAVGLAVLAMMLRHRWNPRQRKLSDVVTLLVAAPVGTLLIAILYCSVLYGEGLLSPWRYVLALRNFWIGNTLGIVTLVPAAPSAVALLSHARRQALHRGQVFDIAVFVAAVFGALWIIFRLANANEYQFFYLLFLPIVWIAVRAGYDAAAVALLFTHVLLVSIATALGYPVYDFIAFQMLMLVLSATGLLLGAAVTESRISEERIRSQQSELARATRHAIVGATGTALAHEISQPLSSATNYLHAARRLLRARGDEHGPVLDALDNAESEARRARETLEHVRDYVSSGRLDLSQVDLEEVTRKIVFLIGREANARDVNIRVTSSPHIPRILADAIQVEQLLLNLISNAIDEAALAKGGRGFVGVHLSQQFDRIVVRVEDNGRGIAPEIADRLFEPFETTKQKGMGLGLTLARQIVDAHGGELRWENLQPAGALFTVELYIDGPRRHDT